MSKSKLGTYVPPALGMELPRESPGVKWNDDKPHMAADLC